MTALTIEITNRRRRMNRINRSSFTLTELLVVMGIIALLSAMTAVGYRAIAKDAKLSSGKNTVMAVLDNARGLAMKNNQIVLVVFRPRLEGTKEQHIEAVTAQYKATGLACVGCGGVPNCPCAAIVDRYAPIPGVPTRFLPSGIKIAAPAYGVTGDVDIDNEWHVGSHLPTINQSNGQGERGGEQIAVLYAPDGSTISQNSASDAVRIFVDYNNNGAQDVHGQPPIDYSLNPSVTPGDFSGSYPSHHGFYEQFFDNDESFVEVAPFLAVFDDDKMRENYDPARWSVQAGAPAFVNRRVDYTKFVTNNADRIHFNRYTGVAMK